MTNETNIKPAENLSLEAVERVRSGKADTIGEAFDQMSDTSSRPKPKKQCAKRKRSGWGSMYYCLFDLGHKGPCSWMVTE